MACRSTLPVALAGALVSAAACGKSEPRPPDYQGIVELDERVLAFEAAGRVEAVPVRRGDVIEDGQLVAKLDDSIGRLTRDVRADDANTARADLALIRAGSRAEDIAAIAADVRAATAAEEFARKTADRARALHGSGALPVSELDHAVADLDRAVAQRKSIEERLMAARHGSRPEEISRAKARFESARDALELENARLLHYELHAKNGGVVLDVHVEPGESAVVGTPAATVADVAHPYIEVFVPETALAGIKVGTAGRVRVDGAPEPTPGVVEYISPKTEFTPRFLFTERERPHLVIRVRVRIDDKRRELHAGVPGFVRFLP
jgi:HlyD family secretion protein